MQQVVDVLLVEDDDSQRHLMEHMLRTSGFTVHAVASLAEARDALRAFPPRVVLSDYHLPDGEGVELCQEALCIPSITTPYLIIVTGSARQKEAEILNLGADDYITKPIDSGSLRARVRVGLRFWSVHERLRSAAIRDGLTKLYNHDHFVRLLENEMGRSRRYGHSLALIMLDIDHFKAVNDTFGHLAGNRVLVRVADTLAANIRDVDVLARFGGEEFTVILPESSAAEALHVAERMRVAIRASAHGGELEDHLVTASFGIADVEDARVKSAADLVNLADRALYMAKTNGRDQVVGADQLDDATEIMGAIRSEEVESLKQRIASLSAKAKNVYVQSIASLVQALDEKDPYTARHAANVSFYARCLAEKMGCSRNLVDGVTNAALLHDIGKVGVPDRILLKQKALTPLEKMVMNQVPMIGVRIVDHLQILESEIQIIRHQREYFDGSGIPNGLKGEEIPIGARILLVADAFDAMTTDRVYRARRSMEDAAVEISRLAGKQFDPRVVAALTELLSTETPRWQHRIAATLDMLMLPAAGNR